MIFVVAGTSEAKEVIAELLKRKIKVIASMTTEFAASLLEKDENLIIKKGSLDIDDFIDVFKNYRVRIVIDASHPFAIKVTENVIKASKEALCEYLRFERESLNITNKYKNITEINDFKESAGLLKNTTGNILLTIGSKELEKFSAVIDKSRLFVRVLPISEMIKKCEYQGIYTSNIIGMKGSFSKELNIVLLKDLEIKYLVTKESGLSGGLLEKLDAANEVGISVILIKRKELEFPAVCNSVNSIIEYIEDNYVY